MVDLPDPMAEIRAGFFVECDDLLENLTDALTMPGFALPGSEAVHSAFRAVHSIKGGAAAFGLNAVVAFAHEVENCLGLLRDGQARFAPGFTDHLMRAADHLGDLVDAARQGLIPPEGGHKLLAGMQPCAPASGAPATDAPPAAAWLVSMVPGHTFYATGNEPLHLLNALTELGEATVVCDTTALPTLEDMDPETGFLRWQIAFGAAVDEAALREVFAFVEDICALNIARQTPDGRADHPIPANAHRDPLVMPAAPSGDAASVRVDLARIDRMMNLVGEMVIGQSMLTQALARSGLARHSALTLAVENLGAMTAEVQEAVITLRSQSVKPLFQRMARILREASQALGKPAAMVFLGENTEVDRSIIERLADPLTHMIRNAVDHGLETPAERRAAGKSECGTITLSAAHRSGRIVIELSDDGKGIQRDKVRKVAVQKGLIGADDTLTNDEMDMLLFRPGFSTNVAVSAMSGRGVGMDVVKAALLALGGRISLHSDPGQGCRFTLSLPLTMAVLDGLVVRAGGQTLVVPLAAVLETAAVSGAAMRDHVDGKKLIRLRGQHVSSCDLAKTLGFACAAPPGGRAIAVLISDEDDRRVALIVDEVLDQRQVVIKSLGRNCGQVPGVAAATILGDGRVALILDPGALFRLASHEIRAASPSAPSAVRLAG